MSVPTTGSILKSNMAAMLLRPTQKLFGYNWSGRVIAIAQSKEFFKNSLCLSSACFKGTFSRKKFLRLSL
jgi:hypothetical protein